MASVLCEAASAPTAEHTDEVGMWPTSSGPARGPQRVSMRGGDGVPWPAAGADFLEFFSFFAIFYLFSWEFGVLAAMLSRLATACRRS